MRAGARRRRAGRRRAHRAAVRRGAHPRRGLHHRAGAPASAPSSRGSPSPTRRSCSSAATTRTRIEAAVARRRRRPAHRRRLPRRRHDLVARGEARRRARRAHDRARAARALGRRPERLQILDVRERAEWDAGHIPGSVARALPRHRRAARRASTPAARSRSICGVRAARRGRRQPARSASARARSSTSSTAACRSGGARAGRSTRPARAERVLAAIPLGLAIGLAVGMLGGGGSVLAVPVLVYVLGQGVEEATTASLVIVAAGALAGGVGHALAGRVCWRHAGTFTAAALPGIVVGTVAGQRGRRDPPAGRVRGRDARAPPRRRGGAPAQEQPARRRLGAGRRVPAAAHAARPRGRRGGRVPHRAARRRRRVPDRADPRRRARVHDAHGGRHVAGDHHRDVGARPGRAPARRADRRRGRHRRR